MPDTSNPPSVGGAIPLHTVRLVGAEEGVVKIVRALSRSYGGMFTHHIKKRSEYCRGPECRSEWHRQELYWRGYFAAELFDPKTKLWLPCVWELTEQSECDLRDSYKRGLVWEMTRKDMGQSKNPPAVASLYGRFSAETLPEEWDYSVVLRRVYHVHKLDLSVKNPMPPRLVLPPSQGSNGFELLSATAIAEEAERKERMDYYNRARAAQRNGSHPPQAARR